MAEEKESPPGETSNGLDSSGDVAGESPETGGETSTGDRQTVDELPVGDANGADEATTTPSPVQATTTNDRGISPPSFTVTDDINGLVDTGVGDDELPVGNGEFPEVSQGLSRKVSSAGSDSSSGSSSGSSRPESRVDLSHLWVPDPNERHGSSNGRNLTGRDDKKRMEARKKLLSIRQPQEEDTMDSIRKRLVEVNGMVSGRGFVLHTLDKMGDSKRALVHKLEELHPRDFKKMYTSHLKGLARFRHAVEILMILVNCSRFRRRYHTDNSADTGMPQATSDDTSSSSSSSPFSSKNYSNKSSIGWELEMHLTTPPEIRSQDQIKKIIRYLKSTKPFSVFPTDMENEVARCVAYERYDNGRVIAFQQRKPERFYYVLTGRVNLVRLYQFSASSDVAKSMGFLAKGKNSSSEEMESQSPGEYTMVCKGQVEVLLIEREYYFYLQNVQSEPPIDFLRKDKLILKENAETNWMYIVKSGKCKLVRRQSVESANNSHLFRGKRPEDVACGRPFSHADIMMSHQLQAKRKTTWPLYTSSYNFEDDLLEAMKDPFLTSFANINSNINSRNRVRKPRGRIHLPPLRHPHSPGSGETSARSRRSEVGRSRVGKLPHADGDIQLFLQDTVNDSWRGDAPSVRHAYLQLGFVGPGEIFGTSDLLKNYKDPDDEYKDEVQSVSLVSDGAELVLINKRFFLKYASNQALMKIQAAHNDVVSPDKATESLTQQDTWGQYKKVIMKKTMSPNGVLYRSSLS
uniref:Cyclic nucleotide-binding domain-containing protein n=1 Tax=Branchiostoma floridae TaxID=7739 RepID=C3YS85_BRAFL|eukprot:XP_002600978.1 hypothetical protein BRAFLDRAFT_79181 [Branchiostoma floridae]